MLSVLDGNFNFSNYCVGKKKSQKIKGQIGKFALEINYLQNQEPNELTSGSVTTLMCFWKTEAILYLSGSLKHSMITISDVGKTPKYKNIMSVKFLVLQTEL